MSCCCNDPACAVENPSSPRYRKVLWIALAVNAAMFAVEIAGGVRAGSMSLFADALDFGGDAANYGISLATIAMGRIWSSRAAMLKGVSMLGFGLFVLGRTALAAYQGRAPEPITMGAIAVLALVANAAVALMLYAFREGNADMRSVWLCSRNDAIGNVAVLLAAAGVWGTGQGWPDLLVALVMGGLAVSSGWSVLRQARRELRSPPARAVVRVDAAIEHAHRH